MKKMLFSLMAFVPIMYTSHSRAQCTPVAPYSENFDGASWVSGTGASNSGDAIDPCWTRNPASGYFFGTRTGTTSSTSTGPSGDFTGGGKYVFTEGSNGTSGNVATITSPAIDLSALTIPYLTFYYHMYGTNITQLDVEVSADGGTTWTNEGSIVGQQQTASADPWAEYNIVLSGYAGQTVLVRFSTARGTSFNCDVSIDEFSIVEQPSCLKPINLMVSNITASSIDLSWTSQGTETMWNIEYGPSGFTQGTGTTLSTVNNPETIGGLTGATSYDFYVQADCGGGDLSVWQGPVSAFTSCPPTFPTPYTENFDGIEWVSGTGGSNTGDAISACWTRNPSSGFFFGTRTGTTSSGSTGPSGDFNGGGKYVFSEASNGTTGDLATITSPSLDLSFLTSPYLRFYYHMYGADITSLEIEVSNDGGTTWNNEGSIIGQQQTSNGAAWLEFTSVLSAYAGQTIQVRFSTTRGGSFNGDVSIDQFSVVEAPTCPPPSSLMATMITDTEVTLSWTAGGTETMWNIEYGPAGFSQGTGTFLPVTTNPYTVTGLTPQTGYSFYLQADCGGGDESTWIGPINITTQCAAFTAPFLESFDIGSLPACWTNSSSNPVNNGLWEFTGNPDYGAASNGRPAGTFTWSDGSSPAVADVTLTSPLIDVSPLTIPTLKFQWFSNNIDNPGDNVPLIVDVNNGTGWANLITVSGDNPNWQEEEITLAAYIGQTIQIRFITDQTATSGSAFYNDILLDSVQVLEGPTCPKPTPVVVSNITSTQADIDWTPGYLETEWVVEYDTAGFTLGTGNEIVTTNLTETLLGLLPNTLYDVYVRAICAPGDTSAYRGPSTFRTECATFAAIGFCESFDSGSQTESCWTVLDENGDGEAWNTNYTFNTNTGDQVAIMYTDFNAGANDDWLISPQMTLTGNEVMNFFYRVQSSNEPNDFELLLSTTGINPADFQDTLMYLASYDNTTYMDTTVDLSAFTGDVYIAFHVPAGGLDGWRLYIDDVCFDVCIPTPGQDGAEDVCRLDGQFDLNSAIVRGQMNGNWVFPGNQSLIVNDSLLNVSILPSGTYDVYYIVPGGCQDDTTTATVNIFPPSSAGQNGNLTVCLNEPINLFDGLTGNVDLGGTWYDPANNPLPNSQPTAANIPGSYNYDYITSNGVCPADTALVVVNVDGGCNYLSLGEEKLAELSVYPNPATSVLNIVNPSNSESLRIEIVDMNGRIVLKDAKSLANATEATISVEHLEKGMYTLRIFNEEGNRTFKIVKQ
ncbi:MAG: choice-of-anchor J domain-containing protein [Brumimicrobium sp.]|nr:choice-of-anchor J domain-containing protein [Brumimicrobium sp.]